MIFTSNSISIKLCQPEGTDPIKTFELFISDEAEESSWQVSSLAQICSQFLSLLSGVTEMEILSDPYGSGEDDFPVLDDPIEWLELFRPFTDVQTLFISGDSQSDVVSSLQVLTMESVMEMLPALQNLYCPKPSGHLFSSEPALLVSTMIYQPQSCFTLPFLIDPIDHDFFQLSHVEYILI
ncbi:hypothetical protein BGW80DRAFT_1313705 [Lactifluus volemus]|nr:hypothetical protein BGW80DRAFT_1313705 [Lactifluus volemus]